MPFELFGLSLISASLSEYLFGSVITCGVVNLLTSKLWDTHHDQVAKQMIGRNHDISKAMETAFEMAVKEIAKPYLCTVPETADEIGAKACYDGLMENRRELLFGKGETSLNDEKIRDLLLPDKTERISPETIQKTRAAVYENVSERIAPYLRKAPDPLKADLAEKLPHRAVFYFREMFKNDQRVFAALTVDGIADLKIQMAALQEMIAGLDLPGSKAASSDIQKAIVRFSEVWLASDEKLDHLLSDLGRFREEMVCRLDGIAAGVDAVGAKVDTVDGKMDMFGAKVDYLSDKFKALQHPSPEQLEAIRRQVENLRQAMIREGRQRQTSRRKSVGRLPAEKLFVDREAYLGQMENLVADERVYLILVTGQGGIGKTALAARFCENIEKGGYRFPDSEGREFPVDGLIYVSRTELQSFSLDRLFEKLTQILEPEDIERLKPVLADPQAPVALKTEQFLEGLGHGTALLILDNFELMLEETKIKDPELADFLQTLCQTAHGLKILITSRNHVNLDALGVMECIELNQGLEDDHAVAFLRKLGAKVRGIRDADDDQLRRLAQKVHGVPMALRSLASFLSDRAGRRVSIEALLNDETRFADFKQHDYQKGLRRLIAEQYAELPDEAKLALQVLAVFNTPVTPVAVRYLLPHLDAEAVLDALAMDFFLAQENQDEFELHPSVQDFAYEQIPETSPCPSLQEADPEEFPFTRTALHTRAADFFAQLKKPESEWKSLPDLQAHLNEFAQRVKARQYERAARILLEIDFHYLLTWGHLRLMAELHESLRGKLQDPDLKARSVGNLGAACYSMGRVDQAIGCYEQALEIARETNSRGGEAAWLGNLGLCYADLGDPARAIEYLQQALEIDREIGYRQGEATSLGNLGNCYYALGDPARAIEYYEQALEIAREIGDRQGEAIHLGNLGNCYADLGDPARAIEYHQQALEIAREIGYRQGEAIHLGNLGLCYAALGDPARAIEYHQQALEIAREIGFRQGEATHLGNLGLCYAALGDPARAIEYHQQSLEIKREIGYRYGEACSLVNWGDALAALGQWEQAIANYQQAILIADEMANVQTQNEARTGLASAYLCTGKLPQAGETIEQAAQYDLPNNMPNVHTLGGIIALRLEQPDTAKTAFTRAIETADALLACSDKNYEALDARALSLCGLALCESDPGHLQAATQSFQASRAITQAEGIVNHVKRRFEQLAKADGAGILAEMGAL